MCHNIHHNVIITELARHEHKLKVDMWFFFSLELHELLTILVQVELNYYDFNEFLYVKKEILPFTFAFVAIAMNS